MRSYLLHSHWKKRAALLIMLGLPGWLLLFTLPIPRAVLNALPAGQSILMLQLQLLLNPLLLLVLSALLGALLAHRIGLLSIVAGTAPVKSGREALLSAALLGLLLGLFLVVIDYWLAPLLGETWQQKIQQPPSAWPSLVVSIFYGGITEEIILRWGVMTVIAWVLLKVVPPKHDKYAFGLAILLSAIIFAVAHLPALASTVPVTSAILLRTLLLNGIFGILYGWLFWRNNLESGMTVHVTTHIGMYLTQKIVY